LVNTKLRQHKLNKVDLNLNAKITLSTSNC